MRTLNAGAEPDAATRRVTLPASWGEPAAAALAALAPGTRAVSLAEAAEAWIRPLARRAWQFGGTAHLDVRLHGLLLRRQAAPNAVVWASGSGPGVAAPAPAADRSAPDVAGPVPGFVLSLPAFHEGMTAGWTVAGAGRDGGGEEREAGGFDVAGFVAAVETVAEALRLLGAEGGTVAMSGLDALLAALGVDYASQQARDVASCLAALLRARLDATLSDGQRDLLRAEPSWPEPPGCVVQGLAEAARSWRVAAGGLPELAAGAVGEVGAADALLGLETGGIAPAFSAVTAEGALTQATQARLAARGMSPEAALAAVLQGETLLVPAGAEAHAAMHDAVARFLPVMPTRPVAVVRLPAGQAGRRRLPARHAGAMQRASLGGHRLFLRTGEYADGALGEIAVSLPRESAMARGLMDGFAEAVSLGLQHGVPLQSFVEAFAGTRFGPAGAVEDDHAIGFATSPLDYIARTLSAHYLGAALPAVGPVAATPRPSEPELPLELPPERPREPRRARLRLVA